MQFIRGYIIIMINGIKGKLLQTSFTNKNRPDINRKLTFFLDLLNDIRHADDYIQLRKNNEWVTVDFDFKTRTH